MGLADYNNMMLVEITKEPSKIDKIHLSKIVVNKLEELVSKEVKINELMPIANTL